MKLVLVHGNFQDALIKRVSEIKANFDPLSITEISSNTGSSSFSSPSLFSSKRLIILENPDLKMIEKTIDNDPDLTIIIKFSKSLEKTSPILKKVVELKGEVLIFDETSRETIFPFLDMLGNLNRKGAFSEFEKNYKEMGGQYLLTMLAYFLRRMIQKPKSGSDFMRQKIETQKRNFNLEKITKLYREIIETDFKIKQGLIEEKFAVTLLVQKILS